MTLADFREKCKNLTDTRKDVLLVAVLVLACLISFALGYFAGLEAGEEGNVVLTLPSGETEDRVFASKTGSVYYRGDCSGATRVSEENKIWFTSATAAVSAGYSAARGCSEP